MRFIRNNEHGYTLVIALGIVVLFMIMGIGLMTLNMNSTTKNETRESNTQAQDLSIKGIDYILNLIQFELANSAIENSGFSKNQFKSEFPFILNKYICSIVTPENSTLINTQTGSATYCIEEIRDTNSDTLKEVVFKSVGNSNNAEHTTRATYLLGSTSNEFKYALITYDNDQIVDNEQNTKGNIELHGGVQLQGDVYADNKIITSNSSRYKNTIVPSVFPIIQPIIKSGETIPPKIHQASENIYNRTALGTVTPKILEDINKINDPDFTLEYNKINNGDPIPISKNKIEPNIDFDIVNRINNAKADISNGIVPLETGFLNGHIIPKLNNYAYLSESRVVKVGLTYPTEWLGATATALNTTKDKVLLQGYLPSSLQSLAIGDINNFNWSLFGKNELKSVIFPKNLSLSNGVEIPKELDIFNWSTNPILKVDSAYIGNNMVIGLNNKNEANFGLLNNMLDVDALGALSWLEKMTNFDTAVHLEGTYYVNGDLIISSAQLTGDATFFVKGDTTILFADIGVKRFNQADSKFNIISHGPVKIAYVGNNHNDNEYLQASKKYTNDVFASEWIGHIHSDSKISIDGASSNFYISGSISSKEINITTIKGRAIPSCRDIGYYTQTHLVGGIVDPILSSLLSDKITKELLNAVFGKEDDGEDFNMVMDIDRNSSPTKYNVNCFEKVAGQQSDIVKPPSFLIKLLGIQLIGTGSIEHKVVPRVQINHNDEPIDYLKNTFNIEYGGDSIIWELDPPKELSRE